MPSVWYLVWARLRSTDRRKERDQDLASNQEVIQGSRRSPTPYMIPVPITVTCRCNTSLQQGCMSCH